MTLDYLVGLSNEALKIKDTVGRSVYSGLLANVKKTAIDKGIKENEITEELIDSVILKELKTLDEMIYTCPIDRKDLMDEYTNKRIRLNNIAPEIINDRGKIHDIIIECAEGLEITIKNKGLIMRNINSKYKGKIDMRMVNDELSYMINNN